MIIDDQHDVIACLSDPGTYGLGHATVERIDTHSAIVFLAGDRAYKLKRAVRYDYLDFSTRDRRRRCCEAEVELNRRTAPSLYLGVESVSDGADGRLHLGGTGTPRDWVVVMRRFAADALFDQLAARSALDVSLMGPLAVAVRALHDRAEPRYDHGGQAGLSWVVEGNAAGLAEFGALDRRQVADLNADTRAALARSEALLESRRLDGWVRQCHGDLHLRNIVLIDGRPTLFDAIEFDDRISCVDVLYDAAFLVMDLWRRNLRPQANAFFNAYIATPADISGLAALPLFLSCRSAVRAKTSATAASLQERAEIAGDLQALARGYLTGALQLLHPPAPRLVALAGYSGSGKTTVARRLAPRVGAVPGALVLRSDELRKSLAGVSAETRLGADWYRAEVSEKIYRTLLARTGEALRTGHSVIVDAACLDQAERRAMAGLAHEAGVGFTGVWLQAPQDMLERRVEARLADASDATVAVLHRQLASGPGVLDWPPVDASGSPDEVTDRVAAIVDV